MSRSCPPATPVQSVRVVVALLMIAGLACACSNTLPGPNYPAYKAAERLPLVVCQVEEVEEPLLCGELDVYENRPSAQGRTIQIRVVVIPAQSGNTMESAWIEHPGGPRYSTIATAHYYASGGWLESFRRNRDIVLVDVRGLHESNPLYCEALSKPRVLERYYPPEAVAACREELGSRAALEHYSTLNAIDDYEDIRQWLGYDQWDAGGWSFGARFMLTYLHRYPSSLRTISLFIPAILNFERPLDYARFGQRAWNGVVSACRKDTECASSFPTIDQDLATALTALEANALSIEVPDPNSDATLVRALTRDVFAEEVWIALLETPKARQLPYVIHHAARGNFSPFLSLVVPETPQAQEPEGHYFSVVCPEETSRLTIAGAAAASKQTFVGNYIAKDYIEACNAWNMPPNPNFPIRPQKFHVPALIVTGELDPVAAPEYGERNAAHFHDVVHLTIPQMSHGQSGMENGQCLGEILSDFVDSGSVYELDVACVDTMHPPPFRLK